MTPVGAEHPLAPESLAGRRQGIIATQEAVPVQRADSFAVRARLLLERKSCCFSSRSSRAKQKSELDIRRCCQSTTRFVELFSDGTVCGVTRLIRISAKGATALNGTVPALTSQTSPIL
jgi:hypothetical protein